MHLTLYSDPQGFAELQPVWNALLKRARFDTIFLTWEWQSTWWRCLGQERGQLYLLAAYQGESLAGILPFYLTDDAGGRRLQVVGCVEVSDYLDLVVENGAEAAVYAALLDWLDGPEAPEWDVVDLCNQPAASLAHSLLPEMARAKGWHVDVGQEDVCPIVALPGTWDEYLSSLDKKQRHEIRRKLKRVERETTAQRVYRVSEGPDVVPAMDRFIELHRMSDSAKAEFMTGPMPEFFRQIAAVAAERGWLDLSFLELDGRHVAGLFCFQYCGSLQVYNAGFDPAGYAHLSTGWVLLARVIQDAIARGIGHLDFLQGNEDYKYRFGGVDTPVYRTLVSRRGPI